MVTNKLEIKDLHVSVDGKKILNGINLEVKEGETHALMGPNGSGKTTLGNVIMGHPKYKIEKGFIYFNGQDISKLTSDKRAKLGLFLAFQHPTEIQGVRIFNFLRNSVQSVNGTEIDFDKFEAEVLEKMKFLAIEESFIDRYLNDGFSGGEKKKFEILQMLLLKPKIAVLDETDSGLDVDSLRIISEGIKSLSESSGILLITHYERILKHVKPQFVHVMIDGKIVKSGDFSLVSLVEQKGYEWFKEGIENAEV